MTGNIVSVFLERQRGQGDKPALVWRDDVAVTFSGLPEEIGRYRAALARLGVASGDRVIVKTENSPAFVYTYLAVLASGAVFVPMNAAYTASEVGALIEDAAPSLLVHAAATAIPDFADAPVKRITLEPDGTGALPDLAASMAPDMRIEEATSSTLAALLFTSGTTGRPKGAMLTHGNLASNVAALHEAWHFGADDVILHCLPLFHAHGLFVALHLGLFSGATVRMLPRFSVGQVIAELPQASVFMGVPTFYSRLLGDDRFDRALVSSIRLFVSGSAPLLPAVFDAFAERTGHRILERYGMTETVMIASNPYEQDGRIAGTVGYPLPGVAVNIVGAGRKPLPAGEIGEIEMTGPNLCRGYWRRADATAESFHDDGYFSTGDTGFKDPGGRITITGRSKDLIISGGFNVYPAEIEILLAGLDGVSDAAVIGVAHPDFGEAVVAVVTSDGPSFDIEAAKDAASRQLAPFKRPKAIFVLDELPRNAMGKVMKAELRQRYAGLFASEKARG